MSLSGARSGRRRGFTLMEAVVALLAVAAAGLLAFSLAWTGRRMLDRQLEWTADSRPVWDGLEMLEEDLAGALVPDAAVAPYFRIRNTPGGSVWTGYTTVAEAAEPGEPLSGYRLRRVEWRLEDEILVREARDAGGGDDAERERSRWAGVTAFSMMAYDPVRRVWTTEWEAPAGGMPPPAARVELEAGAERLTLDAWIAAGMRWEEPR